MSLKLLLVFTLAEFLVSITPGPAVLLVVSHGMRSGFKASLSGIFGIEIGNTIFFALSALGLGAVLIASASLFQIIRWLGVAYLIVMGMKMLVCAAASHDRDEGVVTGSGLKLVSQGLLTQLINPKALLYFTALLPQFISTGQPVVRQFVVLGAISMAVEIPVLGAYGWLAARGGRLIPRTLASLPDRVAGAFLIGAGVGLASIKKI